MNSKPRPHLQNRDGAIVLLQENGKSKKIPTYLTCAQARWQHVLAFQTAKNRSNHNKQTGGIRGAVSEQIFKYPEALKFNEISRFPLS